MHGERVWFHFIKFFCRSLIWERRGEAELRRKFFAKLSFKKAEKIEPPDGRLYLCLDCHASPVRDARLPSDSGHKQPVITGLVCARRFSPSGLLTTA